MRFQRAERTEISLGRLEERTEISLGSLERVENIT